MIEFKIDLPPELGSELAGLGFTAESDLSDWVADAVRLKLSATKQLQYLESRAARGNGQSLKDILAKVPAVPPAEEDRW